MLLNYHIGRYVLGSLCVGDLVWLGWSGIRVTGFSLQHGHYSNPFLKRPNHSKVRLRLMHESPKACFNISKGSLFPFYPISHRT